MSPLDIDSAIYAHARWKWTFEQACSKPAGARFEPQACADHSRCVLSSWLVILARENTLHQQVAAMEATHRQFHEVAGAIAAMINQGNVDEASKLLKSQFSALSESLIDDLEHLKSRTR